jgi:hypothetical protein
MSIERRITALEQREAPASNWVRLIADNGETAEQVMARYRAAHPSADANFIVRSIIDAGSRRSPL